MSLRLSSIAKRHSSMSSLKSTFAWLLVFASFLKTFLQQMMLRDQNSSLPLHASGVLVEDMPLRMVFHTRSNSPTGGRMSGKLSSSHQRVQFSTTMSILRTPSLKTGVKCPTVISLQPSIPQRVSPLTQSQLLRLFLPHS